MWKKILISIGVFIVFILLLIGWYIKTIHTPREEVYYIPEVGVYVKTIRTPIEDIGYILFSRECLMTLSDSVDYVEVGANVSSTFLFNPENPDEIYLIYNGNVLDFHQVKFKMEKETAYPDYGKDTFYFYRKKNPDGPSSTILKEPYIEVSIAEYFNQAYIAKAGEGFYTRLSPLKK